MNATQKGYRWGTLIERRIDDNEAGMKGILLKIPASTKEKLSEAV